METIGLNMAINDLRLGGYNGPVLVEMINDPDAELHFGTYSRVHKELTVPAWVLRELPEGTFLGSDGDEDFDDDHSIELHVCMQKSDCSLIVERRFDLNLDEVWEQTSAAIYVIR